MDPQVIRRKSSELDRGRVRFLVALGSFLINLTVLGLVRSVGVIYVALVDSLGVSRQLAAWPFSLCSSLLFLMGPLAGVLSAYFSIRAVVFCGILLASLGVGLCALVDDIGYIIFFFGGVQGVGVCMSMTLSPVLINQYFIRHRTTAAGIAYAGGSVGSFLYPPAVEYLLEEYGLKGCFLIFSGLLLHGLIGASLFRPPPWLAKSPTHQQVRLLNKAIEESDSYEVPENVIRRERVKSVSFVEQDLPLTSNHLNNNNIKEPPTTKFARMSQNLANLYRVIVDLLRNPFFIIVSLSFAIFFNCFLTYLTIIVDHAKDKNMSETDAVLILSVFSVTDFFGRLTIGWVSDKQILQRRTLVIFSFFGIAAGTEVLSMLSSYPVFLAVSGVYGLLSGTLLINYPTLLTEYVGLERLAIAMGLSGFLVGIISLTRPYIIGVFRDAVNSYVPLFHLMASLLLLGGLMWLVEPLLQWLAARRADHEKGEEDNFPTFNNVMSSDPKA